MNSSLDTCVTLKLIVFGFKSLQLLGWVDTQGGAGVYLCAEEG